MKDEPKFQSYIAERNNRSSADSDSEVVEKRPTGRKQEKERLANKRKAEEIQDESIELERKQVALSKERLEAFREHYGGILRAKQEMVRLKEEEMNMKLFDRDLFSLPQWQDFITRRCKKTFLRRWVLQFLINSSFYTHNHYLFPFLDHICSMRSCSS